jgi:hypothetical protein
MALDKFTITVDNLHILLNDFVANNTSRYGSSNNVVYAVDITATALKQQISIEEKIQHVHVPYNNADGSYINYDDLTEDVVITWVNNGLNLMRGANAVTTLQNTLESKIDKIIADSTPNLPWKKNK